MVYADIEVTNRCNLRCPMCPVGSGSMKRKKMDLPLEVFMNLIDETPSLKGVNLSVWGEPLLHPDLSEMVGFCHDRGIYTLFVTNGILLNPEISSKLVGSLDEMHVSIDGVGEVYERMRCADYQSVRDGLIPILNLMKKAVKLVIRTTITELNDRESILEEIRADFPMIDEIRAQPAVTYKRREIPEGFVCRSVREDKVVVLSNGAVVLCCVDFEGTSVGLGNIYEDGMDLSHYLIRRKNVFTEGVPDICHYCTEAETFAEKRFEK